MAVTDELNSRNNNALTNGTRRLGMTTETATRTANGLRDEMAKGDNGERVESSSFLSGESAKKSPQQQQPAMNQFEDDEDLFRMDFDRGSELINASGRDQQQQQQTTNDNEPETQQEQRNQLLGNDQRSAEETAIYADGQKDSDLAGERENNESSAGNQLRGGSQRRLYEQDTRRETTTSTSNTRYQVVGGKQNGGQEVKGNDLRLRFVKFVHNIAPELSCYTGLGERYRGNLSSSVDRRTCLHWFLARGNISFELDGDYDGHNHCRNPNGDPRGPWCYVRYNEDLDAEIQSRNFIRVVQTSTRSPLSLASSGINGNLLPDTKIYVQRECLVSPCSEFLWLYIVAPPLGLLLVLTCLVYLLVRSRRKSLYESMFATKKTKKTLPKLGKLLRSKTRFAPRKIGASSKKKSSVSYLEDDIFEIVDDLDWSDGQAQSMSPKSTESLKLNSSFSGSSFDNQPKLAGCKSVNPIFDEKIIDDCRNGGMKSSVNRSITQVGPMFATLRCHLRSTSKTSQTGMRSNKSSTFIEQAIDSASGSDSSPSSSSHGQNHRRNAGTSPSTTTSHLISYSSTAEDMCCLEDGEEKYVRCCDLLRLNTDSIAILTDVQPLYEGKMSQVLLAYAKSPETNSQSETDSGDCSAQAAVCSLKQSSDVDSRLFWPNQLKLRHLNHLNILKLIGFTLPTNEPNLERSCNLVYDMANLMDLSEWLKQQNRENGTIEGGLRRNLTCLSKQIALALDYLHDRGLIYKDLACRNCFLDPKKMLVKLANFNTELVLTGSESAAQSLKAMVRPKYLNDYYVINSRPSDCQLLPLSWIPLESILFNKFNKQTDIWSFGCLVYELFSLGEVAYFGYSSKQIIDAVRSNLMPPQPLLCSNGIYKLMCNCLSDIPSNRPNIKQVYEQLNLYSGQCSSFLDHHLCSLLPNNSCDDLEQNRSPNTVQSSKHPFVNSSITKTKSYANIRNHTQVQSRVNEVSYGYDNLIPADSFVARQEVSKLPLSKSTNLANNRLACLGRQHSNLAYEYNHYDEPVANLDNLK